MDRYTPIIPAEYVANSLQFSLSKGLTLRKISALSGVNVEGLPERTKPFSLNDIMRLFQASATELQMPHYGLANGNRVNIMCHGLAGLSVMSQLNYAECLRAASRVCDSTFPPLVLEYFENDKEVGVRIFECLSLAPYTRYFMEWIMTNFRNIFRFLLGSEVEPNYIAFPYQQPEYVDEYKRYLNCDLYFDVDYAEFVVDKTLAERPLPLASGSIASVAENRLYESTDNENLNCVVRQARSILVKKIESVPTMDALAEMLGMNSRTLRRQLSKQGTSYKELVDTLRREATISQLAYSNKSITNIGQRLGYCDTAAFSNAFKRWTGQTPRQFRTLYGRLSQV